MKNLLAGLCPRHTLSQHLFLGQIHPTNKPNRKGDKYPTPRHHTATRHTVAGFGPPNYNLISRFELGTWMEREGAESFSALTFSWLFIFVSGWKLDCSWLLETGFQTIISRKTDNVIGICQWNIRAGPKKTVLRHCIIASYLSLSLTAAHCEFMRLQLTFYDLI